MEIGSEDIFILVKYFILYQVKSNNSSFDSFVVLQNQVTFDPCPISIMTRVENDGLIMKIEA